MAIFTYQTPDKYPINQLLISTTILFTQLPLTKPPLLKIIYTQQANLILYQFFYQISLIPLQNKGIHLI